MIHNFENLEVAACCAGHLEHAKKKAEQYGIKGCTYEEILADPSIASEMKGKRMEALRKQNFTSDEQARVVALEGVQNESVATSAVAPSTTTR